MELDSQNSQNQEEQIENFKAQKVEEFDGTQEARLVPKNLYYDMMKAGQENIELTQFKLPSSVRMVPQKFDEKTYQIEGAISFTNEVSKTLFFYFHILKLQNGNKQTNICPVDNIVRWREGQSKEKSESNIMDNMEYLNDTDKKSIQENSVVSD